MVGDLWPNADKHREVPETEDRKHTPAASTTDLWTYKTCMDVLQTQERMKLSFESNYMFFKKIDALPGGQASWKVEIFEAVGDKLGEDGKPRTERVELWKRNVVDCVRELMGNPLFREAIRYAPERQYADSGGKTRIYGNSWTANWWWDVQVSFSDSRESAVGIPCSHCDAAASCGCPTT